jgi:3-methyladenine DNA glycosylase AlkD
LSARRETPRERDLRERLIAGLRAAGSRERAAREKRYHKSSWEHWGAPAPSMDLAIRATLADATPDEIVALSERMWREPVWDLKAASARMLSRPAVPPDDRLWGLVRTRMKDLDGWALADTLAGAGSRCLLADPRRLDDVEPWTGNPHLWTRRAALVFTLPWTKGGRDPERMLGWAAGLAADPEWFIQKAIGWWLRELSKRDAPRVRRFIAEHCAAMKSFARREALRRIGGG